MDAPLDFLDEITKKQVQKWLDGPYDDETKKEILTLIKTNPEEIKNAFFQKLSFGTGGARGKMGVGTNRINIYTIRFAAQGLSNFLLKNSSSSIRVLIGYDNRKNSKLFAEETAKVLAANGIIAYLFSELRPTPLVSFGCRFLKCSAAVMITASHNPPIYNGFKVYGSDGGQVLSPYDQMIIDEVNKIDDLSQIKIALLSSKNIKKIYTELDTAYLETLDTLQLLPSSFAKEKKDLKILYTNLHGTGITLIPSALKRWGFSSLHLVDKQTPTDGNFPFAPKPNPEERQALELGIEIMKENQADLLLASDPDADRLGVVVNQQGKEVILSGNQIGSLLLYHIASSLAKEKKLPLNSAVIKSIVTSELISAIASSFDVSCVDVLTGFKYIGEKMTQWEEDKSFSFLFGVEESLGFLYGTHVRDKDAVIAACLVCEVAAQAKKERLTLVDKLYALYKQYGIFREALFSLSFEEGEKGMQQMQEIMKNLRKSPFQKIGNYTLARIDDYLIHESRDFSEKTTELISLPKSDVLAFIFSDKSRLIIRPSGTEPKIKIYAQGYLREFSSIEEGIAICEERLQALLSAFKQKISSLC